MCSPSPPPAPNFAQAAQAQGQANIDTAITQGQINNPNVVSPYGTQTVNWQMKPDTAAYQSALAKYNQEKALYDQSIQSGPPTTPEAYEQYVQQQGMSKGRVLPFEAWQQEQGQSARRLSPHQVPELLRLASTQGIAAAMQAGYTPRDITEAFASNPTTQYQTAPREWYGSTLPAWAMSPASFPGGTSYQNIDWGGAYSLSPEHRLAGQQTGGIAYPWEYGNLRSQPIEPVAPTQEQFMTRVGEQPTITQQFSPEQQALFEQSNRIKGLLGGLGEQGARSLQGVVGTPIDFAGLPTAPGDQTGTRDAVINAMMGRVNEDFGRTQEQTNADLVAAGIRPGSKAYSDRMFQLERSRNDARQQAILAGGQEASREFGLQTQRRKDAIAEYLSKRQTPLNEIAALMSGSQVQNPFAIPGYAQNQQVAPPPVFGATTAGGNYATDLYNAQAANQGALMSGLFGLGGAGLGAWGNVRRGTGSFFG
jgi:hypothetical protein